MHTLLDKELKLFILGAKTKDINNSFPFVMILFFPIKKYFSRVTYPNSFDKIIVLLLLLRLDYRRIAGNLLSRQKIISLYGTRVSWLTFQQDKNVTQTSADMLCICGLLKAQSLMLLCWGGELFKFLTSLYSLVSRHMVGWISETVLN